MVLGNRAIEAALLAVRPKTLDNGARRVIVYAPSLVRDLMRFRMKTLKEFVFLFSRSVIIGDFNGQGIDCCIRT